MAGRSGGRSQGGLGARSARGGNGSPPDTSAAPAPCESRPLTARERTVLRLLVDGKRNREISHELDISERTVKFHVSGLFSKLGVSSRTQLVSLALKQGVLEP